MYTKNKVFRLNRLLNMSFKYKVNLNKIPAWKIEIKSSFLIFEVFLLLLKIN